MSQSLNDAMRSIPAVGQVIEEVRRRCEADIPPAPELLTWLARPILSGIRKDLQQGILNEAPSFETVVQSIEEAVRTFRTDSRTCHVVNATGIILHSGLGRAPLPKVVTDRIGKAGGYVLLEVDNDKGRRRRRDLFCEELLCHLTGAEAAFVVNNNAAATMIILNTTGAGKDIVVSRSQMVEIGGSFRLPDVMEMSGCNLCEVGTTNRSYLSDYEDAICETTGALMVVHTSNYKLVGFTEHPDIDAMVPLGKKHDLPVIHDVGSGCLTDLSGLGFEDEPPVSASVKSGADLICFSGDKIIGGTQAGIIVGKKKWVDRLKKNPLARALRIDKMTCIGLEAALRLYLEPEQLQQNVPTLQMLSLSADELATRASVLQADIDRTLGDKVTTSLIPQTSEMGAGSMPGVGLPTTCVTVESTLSPDDLADALRKGPPPIFARIKDRRILLDPRTLQDGDNNRIVSSLEKILSRTES